VNKKALITGASRGIGRAVAIELANAGYDIWINYRSSDKAAEEVYEAVVKVGARAKLLKFDVADRQEVRSVLIPVLKEEGNLDILVNNAGIVRDTTFYWMKDEEWDTVINTNLGGFYNVTKAVLPFMVRKKWGRIISITSISGIVGARGQSNYAAAKGAVIAASKSMAKELARQNILVNCIAPGIIETDMTNNLPHLDRIKKEIPLRKFGKAEDIAKMVRFLCSDDANYITGSVVNINGGLFG